MYFFRANDARITITFGDEQHQTSSTTPLGKNIEKKKNKMFDKNSIV